VSTLADTPLDLAALDAALPVNGLGFPLIYEPVIPSTNSLLFERIAQGVSTGTIALTDAQPAGRGRQGRAWVTMPNQQIVLSVTLDLPFDPHWLVMASALAVSDALSAEGVPAGIKWPNDVQIAGRKVAGILIETTTAPSGTAMAVIGIGANINGTLAGTEIGDIATTVAEELGREVAREPLIVAILSALGASYGQLCGGDPAAAEVIWERWRARLVTLGQRVRVRQNEHIVSGLAEGVAHDGALLVRDDLGALRAITWGDVQAVASR
jgi:BirA family biotin operon repressor/biotin-[acetyl-CoA-carboxylase] ligase